MKKVTTTRIKNKILPVLTEKDEDGFFVASCPLFDGCYTQGKTLDEALLNIKDVIGLCLEEKENKEILKSYSVNDVGFHTVIV